MALDLSISKDKGTTGFDNVTDGILNQAVLQQASTSHITEESAPCLPPEVWERIFLHLKTPRRMLPVRLVCRNWRNIFDGCPSLISRVKLTFPSGQVFDEQFNPGELFPVCEAAFSKAKIVALDSWWSPFGKQLVSLSLSGCVVEFPALIGILRGTPNLRRFKMVGGRCLKLHDNLRINFQLEKLESLALQWRMTTFDIRPEVLEVFVRICPQLKTFEFPMSLRDERLQQLVIELVRNVQSTLESVDLSVFFTCIFLREMSTMKRLRLKEVSLAYKDFVVDQQMLIDFCRAQSTIEQLQLNHYRVSEATLCAIAQALPDLKRLNVAVDWNENNYLVPPSFLNYFPKLENLSLIGKNESCQHRMIDFSTSALSDLKHLYLDRITFTPDSLRKFLNNSPKIRLLTLHMCSLNNWSEIFASSHLKSLNHLELKEVRIINKNDEIVLECLTSVKHLRFNSHFQSDKSSLLKVIRLCPQLVKISLLGGIVDDEVTLAIFQDLKLLKTIKFFNCGISYASVECIRTHCRQLERVEIERCRNLTESCVSPLRSMENIHVTIKW